jgi:predicted RNA-binding protein (virulence factor B family)
MKIGHYNTLTLLRFTAPGAYLGDDEGNDVLLPGKYLTDEMQEGDLLTVFIYRDSEDRIVATTETPLICLGEFAYLKTVEVNAFGAFLDWGLEKHLLVPFKEQNQKMEAGKKYLVTLQMDHATDRLFASMKTNRYLEKCEDENVLNKEVDLIICDKTDLGVKVIVDAKYQGLIFRNDISKPVRTGMHMKGYIYNVREDGKVDVRFEKTGFQKFDDASEFILDLLKKEHVLNLSDKSDPDDIREKVGMSKKTFKQAIGKLYKARKIELKDDSISLIKE